MSKVDTIEAIATGKKGLPKPSGKMLEMIDEYRSHHNPLRGLTMALAIRLLEEGNRGAYADLQWLYKFAERGYEPLKASKGKLQDSIVKLDYNFKHSDKLPEALQPMAKRQIETLRAEYDRIVNFRAAVRHLTTGFFRGYAHVEKHWAMDAKGIWHITKLEPVPQWHWVREGILGEWQFNPKSQAGINKGESVDMAKFVYLEVEDPIDYSALIRFIRSNMGEKDWGSWLEEFGRPHKYATAPETGDDQDKLQQFSDYVEKAFSGSSGALPHGTELNLLEAKGQGADVFKKALDHHAEMVVLATTNSKLTMLAESGTGTLGGGAHGDTWDDVVEARAMDISEAFQAHLDRQILDRMHPGEPVLAYFELAKEDEKDASAVIDFAVKAKSAGFQTDPDEITEKAGIGVTKAETEDLEDPEKDEDEKAKAARQKAEADKQKKRAETRNRDTISTKFTTTPTSVIDEQSAGSPERFGAASLDHFVAGLAADSEPFAARLQEAIDAGDKETASQIVEAIAGDMAEIFEDALANGESVSAMQDILASAVANGADEARDAEAQKQPGLFARLAKSFSRLKPKRSSEARESNET